MGVWVIVSWVWVVLSVVCVSCFSLVSSACCWIPATRNPHRLERAALWNKSVPSKDALRVNESKVKGVNTIIYHSVSWYWTAKKSEVWFKFKSKLLVSNPHMVHLINMIGCVLGLGCSLWRCICSCFWPLKIRRRKLVQMQVSKSLRKKEKAMSSQ